jgi:hypothetical protein
MPVYLHHELPAVGVADLNLQVVVGRPGHIFPRQRQAIIAASAELQEHELHGASPATPTANGRRIGGALRI